MGRRRKRSRGWRRNRNRRGKKDKEGKEEKREEEKEREKETGRKLNNKKGEERSEMNSFFHHQHGRSPCGASTSTRDPFLNAAPKIRVYAVNRTQASFTSPPDPNQD